MELTQLKYFKALARSENLTKTASDLYISAPALSANIARLERELGCVLFHRSPGKKLILSPQGELFLSTTNQVLDILENFEHQLSELESKKSSAISIATATPMLFNDLFVQFKRSHPDIGLSHTYLDLHQLSLQEYLYNFDFIFAPGQDFSLPNYDSHTLYQNDRIMIMLYADHPLAKQKFIDIRDLRDESFILASAGTSSGAVTSQVFQSAGFQPKVSFECSHLMRERLIVEKEGIGITTFFSSLCNSNPDIVFAFAKNLCFRRSQNLYWHSDRPVSAAMLELKEFAVAHYEELERQYASVLAMDNDD